MNRCTHCQTILTTHDLQAASCPHCGKALPEKVDWQCVARMGNLAEVGYFADVLEAQSIPTRVHHRHEFSALDGSWETFYELHVPPAAADAAVQTLRQEVVIEDNSSADDAAPPADASERSPMLRPLFWAALAGGIAYWAGRTGAGPASPEPPGTLWNVVAESPPFWSEPRAGMPRRCLRYDAQSHTVIVEEDTNGDGRADRHLRISEIR
jgi:hypothetical protein